MGYFLSGYLMMGCFVVSLFFYNFYQKSSDRLFKIFSFSFFFMGLERGILVFLNVQGVGEANLVPIYLVRLLSFALILYGIVDKNLRES